MRLAWMILLLATGCGEVVTPPFEPERCFDGVDNEGPLDDLVDCEDPLCGEVALCVPSSVEDVGVVVGADEACPAGFEGGETLLNRGLQPGTCEGCGCQVGATECTARLWTYANNNECGGDVGLSGGSQLGIEITSTCTSEPIYYFDAGGLRADITPTGTCTTSGTPTPAPPAWTETVKFCRATGSGNGCAATHACVPRVPEVATQCALVTGPSACEGFATAEADWYTGADDQRTCGACFCTAVGGDCANTHVEIGSDYTCGDFGTNIADDSKLCFSQPPYSPTARVVGTPTPPVGCTSGSTPMGSIEPTGQMTLCCTPQG